MASVAVGGPSGAPVCLLVRWGVLSAGSPPPAVAAAATATAAAAAAAVAATALLSVGD